MRLLCLAFFCAVATTLSAEDNNTIVIRGNRSEKQRVKGPLRGTTIKPEQSSRFDLDSHYRDQASLLTVRSGQVKPAGFNIPRIRGQDSRASEVFIDTFSVSSPYTGLPIVDELDLRAFDGVTIYQGVSGLDLASVNPVGALQLSFKPVTAVSVMLGGEAGKPHGTSYWSQVKDVGHVDETEVEARLYYREHHTDGVYSFYSDEGTPYRTSDDRIIERKDNAADSLNAVQSLALTSESVKFFYLGLLDRGQHGVPSVGGFDRTYASRAHSHYIHHGSATKEFVGDVPVRSLSLYGSREDSRQTSRDAERRINPLTPKSTLGMRSSSFGSRVELKLAGAEAVVDAAKASARVTQDSGSVVKREHQKVYLGLSWPVLPAVELMGKLLKDTITNDAAALDKERKYQEFNGFAAALQISPLRFLTAYLQFAKQERAPAMFEEFGDGGAVLPSDGLSAERVVHKEFGFTLSADNASVTVAYFQDRTDDKIIVLPSSMANAWRAQNLDRTVISGYEVQTHAKLWHAAELRLSLLEMNPEDKSDAKTRQLPQLAKTNLAGEVAQGFHDVTLRWASRYRSTVYRDTRNSIKLDPLWLHDATADYQKKTASGRYALGVGLFNVFDTTSTGITSVETGQHGRTAITEVRGYPLPGRHWKLYAALGF